MNEANVQARKMKEIGVVRGGHKIERDNRKDKRDTLFTYCYSRIKKVFPYSIAEYHELSENVMDRKHKRNRMLTQNYLDSHQLSLAIRHPHRLTLPATPVSSSLNPLYTALMLHPVWILKMPLDSYWETHVRDLMEMMKSYPTARH